MEGDTTQLPWEALRHTEGDIPWSALYEFAAAVVTNTSLTDDLVELYEQGLQAGYDHEHYEDFYVSAIFAMAAPQLNDQRRCKIGVFLLEKLVEAGREDDDISMEVLTAACGSLGPDLGDWARRDRLVRNSRHRLSGIGRSRGALRK